MLTAVLDHDGIVREQAGGCLVVARVDGLAPALDDRRGVLGVVAARQPDSDERKRR